MSEEVFYVKVTGYKTPRHFGPYLSSEWDPQKTLQEFQSGLTPGFRAELLDKILSFEPQRISSMFGKKKRRKFPSPLWNRKKPLVEFSQGNSRWVIDEGEYVLLIRDRSKGKSDWVPSIFISTEAANELTNLLLSTKLANALL